MTTMKMNLEKWMADSHPLTKEDVQQWLDAMHGGDRGWLAEALGMKNRGTVDHSFSKKGFSDAALRGIKNLMRIDLLERKTDGAAQAPMVTDETALIPMTSGLFERMEAARARVGNPSRPQFYAQAIEDYADRLLAGDPSLARPTKAERKALETQGFRLNDKATED